MPNGLGWLCFFQMLNLIKVRTIYDYEDFNTNIGSLRRSHFWGFLALFEENSIFNEDLPPEDSIIDKV